VDDIPEPPPSALAKVASPEGINPADSKMYYVYVLLSQKDTDCYIGVTNDLERRLYEHNTGQNFSTKHRTPLTLEFYFSYESRQEAFVAERKFKRSHGALERAKKKFGIIPE
jgi:putative endonuclease